MANTILVHVLMVDSLGFFDCPRPMHIPCPGSIIDGNAWYINSDANQTTWQMPSTTRAPAPALSIEVARAILPGGKVIYIAGDASASAQLNNDVADACNNCCGTTEPEITYSSIPSLNSSFSGIPSQDCNGGSCTYQYVDTLPPSGNFEVTWNCNGNILTSGTKTISNILAFAQASWGVYGTWSLTGTVLKVENTACANGNLTHVVI